MKGRWWIAGVAALGLVLAFLLMPRPDTGDVPDANPANVDPGNFKNPRKLPPGTVVSPRGGAPDEIDPDRVRTGPKPGMEKFIEQRNRPEVVYSGKLLAPWSAIRYTLMRAKTDDAKALSDEIGAGVMADLRGVRTAPDARAAMDAVEPAMAAEAEKVAASPWGKDDTVVKSLAHYQGYLDEYHQALASAGVLAEGTTPGAAPAAEPAPAANPADAATPDATPEEQP